MGHGVAPRSGQAPADLEDLLGVEDPVVGLEEGLDGGLVNLHLGAAHAEGAPASEAVTVDTAIGGLDAGDPPPEERR